MASLNEYQVIIRPIMTEKSVQGTYDGKYTFEVDVRANKLQVAEAVSLIFDVEVAKVNIINSAPRLGRWGRKKTRRRPATKKAIVTLALGETIESLGL